MVLFIDAETDVDVGYGDVDSGNSTSHSPAEDKNSLMLTTSCATEGNSNLIYLCTWGQHILL